MDSSITEIKNIELVRINAIIITGVFILLALGVSNDIQVALFTKLVPLNIMLLYVIIPFSASSLMLLITGGYRIKKKPRDEKGLIRVAKMQLYLHNYGITASIMGFIYLTIMVVGVAITTTQ